MMFRMLHEMLTMLMLKVFCEFIYVKLLKQINFAKTNFLVQSECFHVESKYDGVSKLNMLKLDSKD